MRNLFRPRIILAIGAGLAVILAAGLLQPMIQPDAAPSGPAPIGAPR